MTANGANMPRCLQRGALFDCPSYAIIGGFLGEWHLNEIDAEIPNYLNDKGDKLELGDFKNLVSFLIENCGKKFNSEITDDINA